MKLWRITVSGLRGRWRDTRLLLAAVTLSFFFITLTTTVLTSMESIDQSQRSLLYGEWKVMAGGLNEEETERLSADAPAARENLRRSKEAYENVTASGELEETVRGILAGETYTYEDGGRCSLEKVSSLFDQGARGFPLRGALHPAFDGASFL